MSSSSRSRENKSFEDTSRKCSSNNSVISTGSSHHSSSESECESDAQPKKSKRGSKANKALKTTCGHCGKVGYKSLFFGKEKRFCCVGCYRAEVILDDSRGTDISHIKDEKKYLVSKKESSPTPSIICLPKVYKIDEKMPFDWKAYLTKPDFLAAPASCFKHVPLFDIWGKIIPGLKVEVENTDCCNYGSPFYWIATIIKTAGYMALMRYEGFGSDDSQDFWLNMCNDDIHAVGWCALKGKPIIPPKTIEGRCADWKQYLMKYLVGAQTLPLEFPSKVDDRFNTNIQKGMKLEVVDKNRIATLCIATVNKVIGGRLHVVYEESKQEDEGFWCHERSPLIHPVGWAKLMGHEIRATPEYTEQSLLKCLLREFDPDDATWDLFMPVVNPATNLKFKEGMKLEAIDPLNLSTVCVATVVKVLRNNYLMIGIDGMMAANGSDCFCYHASSPCIFPVGFCEANSIPLTPPRGYKAEFRWDEYLRQTKSTAAPVSLFRKDIPDHGFTKGMYLEAVDLMEPRLICVGSVTSVVGRLLRIHFDGWEDAYDQWCDCESPDLYPVGWCQSVGYWLEPPRIENTVTEDLTKKRKKGFIYKGNRKKKRGSLPSRRMFYHSNISRQSDKHEESQGSIHIKSSDDSNVSDPESEKKSESCVDFKLAHFPVGENDPMKWTVSEVTKFLRINECGAYSQIFNEEKIDGPKFLTLTKESLMDLTGMKVGPSLKISHLIQQLKTCHVT